MTTTHRHRWRKAFWWLAGFSLVTLLAGHPWLFFGMLFVDGSIMCGWLSAKKT